VPSGIGVVTLDLCHGCHRPLTADHVLRGAAHYCYRCDLRLLRAQDLAPPAPPATAPRRIYGRATAAPGRPATGVAARRRGAAVVGPRRRGRLQPVGRRRHAGLNRGATRAC
jgi:hypothetical protein